MPIIVHKGDLFTDSVKLDDWVSSYGVISWAHGVNCAGAMGAGIAVKFKEMFPEMFSTYKDRCKNGLIIPGSVWQWTEVESQPYYDKSGRIVERETIYKVYNLAIKTHWRLPATYNAIEASFNNLIEQMEANGGKAVAMPWIGCGLGGLEKKHVQKIMERVLTDKDIVFHVYEI